ncbi:MAG: STAS domain-containing protein [Paludisphaera borealis]|uniref:STAS domain-containing protein n=1 Tax=Paludisphaera borealis TaxID=1387353 RepID=UPI00283AFBD7|nr:STAS domain-containing protein [Paludisphaera borealis]MDR3621338.1 STAS domain-containing protein [Paludisphaera borealis]
MSIATTTPDDPSGRCPVCGAVVADAANRSCDGCGWLAWFTWEDLGDVQVLKPAGNLLHPEPLQKFLDAFTPRPGSRFVLNLADAQYISSAALAKLLTLRKRLLGRNARIVLRSVHPDLWEVFRVTRLDTYFEVED